MERVELLPKSAYLTGKVDSPDLDITYEIEEDFMSDKRFERGDRVEIVGYHSDSDYTFPQGEVMCKVDGVNAYVVELDEHITTELDDENDLTMKRIVVHEDYLSEPQKWVYLVGNISEHTASWVATALDRLDIDYMWLRGDDNPFNDRCAIVVPEEYRENIDDDLFHLHEAREADNRD